MAGIEDLYRNIAGREADADGLAYWNQQLANGTSFEDVTKAFQYSAEYVNAHRASEVTTGVDSGLQWTSLSDVGSDARHGELERLTENKKYLDAKEAESPLLQEAYGNVSYDALFNEYRNKVENTDGSYTSRVAAQTGSYYSDVLGQYVSTSTQKDWTDVNKGIRESDWEARNTLTFTFEDSERNRDGYLTSINKGLDGKAYVLESKKGSDWDFLQDMVKFAGVATMMYTGITAAAEMAGGSTVGTEVASTGTAGTPGTSAVSGASGPVDTTVAGTGNATTQTGFQVSKIGAAPWEQVSSQALGSGLHGIDTVDGLLKLGAVGADGSFSLGGMTLLPDGSLIASADMFGATAPWINPGSSTITDAVINSAGSVGDLMAGTDPWTQYVAGLGDTFSPSENWWDKIVDSAKGTATDIAKEIATGAVAGSVIGTANNGNSRAGNISINIPKPEPSAAALQPSASQRAGVKFGRTRSKRELKGKFSGTGLTLG